MSFSPQHHTDKDWGNVSNVSAIAAAGPDGYFAPSRGVLSVEKKFLNPVIGIPAGVAHILGKLTSHLKALGAVGFVGLQRTLRIIDRNNNKRLSMNDFHYAMREMEVSLNDAEIRMLHEHFDTDHRGSMDSELFIRSLRRPLNERRVNVVKQAFAKLDINGDGAIDAAEVAGMYDATSTPDVIGGRMTAENALGEFLETFDVGGEIDGKVTHSEFINYYTNIGATIDNDEYFELMIRNAWHIGGQWEGSSDSQGMVLVTCQDGSQYVEQVQGSPVSSVGVPPSSHKSINGVRIQTFSVFDQTNDLSLPPKTHVNAQSRPLLEVCDDSNSLREIVIFYDRDDIKISIGGVKFIVKKNADEGH
jgi:Ca2+-binding EF-hand superfamily protein